MRKRQKDFAPRQLEEADRYLRQLTPAEELTFRYALRGMSAGARGYRWADRVEELEHLLGKQRAARCFKRASDAGDRIREAIAEQLSPARAPSAASSPTPKRGSAQTPRRRPGSTS